MKTGYMRMIRSVGIINLNGRDASLTIKLYLLYRLKSTADYY